MTKKPIPTRVRVRRGLHYNPYEHAEQLGLMVIHRPLRTANGAWWPERNLIIVRSGMRAMHDRSTLAHELAHAILGHLDSRPKHERAADRYAGELLIEPSECRHAMLRCPDVPTLSLDLQVSQRILSEYLSRNRLSA